MAEILTEVKGKLIAGPPKNRARPATVGLPPFVVRELEAHFAAAQRPSSHILTAPGGGRCGFRASGALLGAGGQGRRLQGLRIHDLRHTAVALWIAAGATPNEVAVRRAHLGQLDPGRYGHQTNPGRSRRAGAIQ